MRKPPTVPGFACSFNPKRRAASGDGERRQHTSKQISHHELAAEALGLTGRAIGHQRDEF